MSAEMLSPRFARADARSGARFGRLYRAFTLTELVAIAVIIAIVAGIAVPRFARALARHRLDAAARRIAVDVALTRRLAKTRSYQHRLRFPSGTDQYVIEYSTNGVSWQPAAGLDRVQDAYGVDLSEPPYGASVAAVSCGYDGAIVFDGFGAPSQAGSITLVVGECFKVVTVDADTGEAGTADLLVIPLPPTTPVPTPTGGFGMQ